MERLAKFESFASHAWHRRIFKKLAARDVDFCKAFITQAGQMPKNEFEFTVNRLFLDKEKPKAWKEILELLANCS